MDIDKGRFFSDKQPIITDPQVIGRHVLELEGMMEIADDPGDEVGPYSHFRAPLNERIVGQEDAINALVDALNHSEFGDPTRPIGTLMFLGPTGVGKSQTAKEIARLLHDGSEDAFLNINCTQFKSNGDIGFLQGAPPGYIGHDQAALLDEETISRPKSVILFDEVEKAHSTFHNFLMQIVDEGEISIFNANKKVSFRDSLIILTSNAGSSDINNLLEKNTVGFRAASHEGNPPVPKSKLEEVALAALEKIFKPEFLGRIQDKVLFTHLDDEQYSLALEQYVKEMNEREGYKKRGITISTSLELRRCIVENCSRRRAGGFREVSAAFRNTIERELEKRVLSGKIPRDSSVVIVPASDATKKRNQDAIADFRFQSISSQAARYLTE